MRRGRPLQARGPRRRRPRRISPPHVPGRGGQAPLPVAAGVDGGGGRASQCPSTAELPAAVLLSTDHHRPPAGERGHPSEARLSERRPSPLLRPAHRRRARLRVAGRCVDRWHPPGLEPALRRGQEHRHVRARRRGAQHAHRRVLRACEGRGGSSRRDGPTHQAKAATASPAWRPDAQCSCTQGRTARPRVSFTHSCPRAPVHPPASCLVGRVPISAWAPRSSPHRLSSRAPTHPDALIDARPRGFGHFGEPANHRA